MKIGIFAPYDHSETAQAACALSDLFRGLGLDVRYGSFQPCGKRVHPYWDNRVRRINRRELPGWVGSMDIMVWLDVQDRVFQEMTRSERPHILIANRKLFDYHHEDLKTFLPLFNAVVAPNEEAGMALQTRLRLDNVVYIPWHAGLRPVQQRSGLVDEGYIQAFIPADGGTLRCCGNALLSAVDVALAEYRTLRITLGVSRMWGRNTSDRLQELLNGSGNRLRVVRNLPVNDRCQLYEEHDWTVCPAVFPMFGLDALESLCHGIPVATFILPTYSDLIRTKYNGLQVPCDVQEGVFGLVQAEPTAADFVRLLAAVATSYDSLPALQSRAWVDMSNRHNAFRIGWKDLLDC